MNMNDEGGFVIFSGTKLWYSSKEAPVKSQKNGLGKVRASAKSKRIVEFEEFDKLMSIETDTYWRSLFDEAAVGKFPRNFKFQNGVLNYKIRSKTIEKPIPKDLKEALLVVKKFFLETAGILSPDDLKRKKLEEEKRISEMIINEIISWNQIRSEKQRMIMISLYVENIGKQYGLNIEERKGLVQNIRIGVLSGYLNAENIEIVGNCIENIYGLEYNKELNEFEIIKEKCPLPKIIRKITQDDFTTLRSSKEASVMSIDLHSEFSDDDEEDDRNHNDFISQSHDSKSTSLHSSNSMKKRWGKFLSEIGRK
jgi:hypothetical protein